jgi:hypothetical protein
MSGCVATLPRMRQTLLLHELVHRIDREVYGRTFNNETISLSGMSCPRTEFRAGHQQGKYLGASDCLATAFGNSASRAVCGVGGNAKLLDNLNDFGSCYSGLILVEIVAAVAVLVLFPANVALQFIEFGLSKDLVIALLYLWLT